MQRRQRGKAAWLGAEPAELLTVALPSMERRKRGGGFLSYRSLSSGLQPEGFSPSVSVSSPESPFLPSSFPFPSLIANSFLFCSPLFRLWLQHRCIHETRPRDCTPTHLTRIADPSLIYHSTYISICLAILQLLTYLSLSNPLMHSTLSVIQQPVLPFLASRLR